MTRAMILCAGLSTRLGELGERRPKPLLPVLDVPIIRYGIAMLVAHGVRDIVINLHHHAAQFEAELGDGSALGARIRYSHEPEILGTGGGIKRALPLLDPDGDDAPLLSLNGKLILDLDIAALLATHREAGDVLGTFVVRPVPDALVWGAVRVDATERGLRVRDILGDAGDHMFCGVHVTRPSVMRRLPDGEACSIRQGYLPWLRAGGAIAAFEHTGYFEEHSTPERYLAGNLAVLRGARLRHPPFDPATRATIHPTAVVDPTATLHPPVHVAAHATIGAHAAVGPDVIVGHHATVAPRAHLTETVVWPNVTASGTHTRTTLT